MEAFSRVQEGLAVESDEWVYFVYGTDEKQVLNEHGEIELSILSEVPILEQYKEWRRLMTQE